MEPSAAKIAELVQEIQTRPLDLGDLRFRTDSLAIPFRGSAVFGREGSYFSWSFVDSDPAGVTVFAQDVSPTPETGPTYPWPEHGATVNATYPNMRYQCTVPSPSGAAVDDGVVLTLQNLRSNETFVLSGMDPPTGPNVTLINNSVEINSNGVAWGRGFRGSATFDSGWKVEFEKGVFASLGRETCGGAIVFVPPPSRMISIANATLTSAANRTLDFDITTANTTLHGWGVQVEKGGQIVKTLGFTTDPRGPGTGTGTNPVHVSLNWDGLDNNNQPVTGNITWVTTANTTAFVPGGNLNDGVNSVQARYADNLESPELTVTEIKADAAIAYQDDDGQVVADPTFYYSSDSPSNSHQLVLASDPDSSGTVGAVAAKSAAVGPFLRNLQVTLSRANAAGLARYDVRIVDPDSSGEVLTTPAQLEFANGQKKVTISLAVAQLKKVHKYPYLKVQVRGSGDWATAVQNGTPHPVYYSPFGLPKQPFENGEILSQAALDLAWEIEKGAETPDGARRRASARLSEWLPSNNFTYTLSKGHTRYEKTSPFASRQIFKFREFISPLTRGGSFEGDCHDVASLEVMCCAAVGVDQYLLDFVPGASQQSSKILGHMVTKPIHVNAASIPIFDTTAREVGYQVNQPDYRVYPFGDHQIAFWKDNEHGNTAWSSLASIEGIDPGFGFVGKELNEYLDALLANQQLESNGTGFSVVPSRWITFRTTQPYPDPRTGQEPIRLTGIVQ